MNRVDRILKAVLGIGAVITAVSIIAPRVDAQELSASVIDQIAAITAEKEARTPAQRKIDSQLLAAQYPSATSGLETTGIQSSIEVDQRGMTLVDITAKVSAALLTRIQSLGGTIVNSFPEYDAIRASVRIDTLETIADSPDVTFVGPAQQPQVNKLVSQGDITHRANQARSTFHVTGAKVNVGVLSDSVKFLGSLQSAHDLPHTCPAGPLPASPPCVRVLSGQAGPASGEGEGTAMMEIVSSLAPGSNLLFATGDNGEASMATNIKALKTAGAKVIVDDISYFDEPVFQDGIIAQAVNTVVAGGAVYFSSAANDGHKLGGNSGTWEGNYVATSLPLPSGAFPRSEMSALNFGGGNNTDVITQNGSSTGGVITLQWSDAWGKSANDYDLYIIDPGKTQVVLASTNVQNGTQAPFEGIGYNGNAINFRLAVVRHSGQARFMHLATHRGRIQINTTGATYGHNGGRNTVSMAAVAVETSGCPNSGMGSAGCVPFVGGNTNPVEFFSSDGPRRIFYNPNGTAITPGNFLSTGGLLLQKPDLEAADGVQTDVPGFQPFFGTSAAAPHAAAIAALMISRKPLLTQAGVVARMKSTALPLQNPATGLSNKGLINAQNAVNASVP